MVNEKESWDLDVRTGIRSVGWRWVPKESWNFEVSKWDLINEGYEVEESWDCTLAGSGISKES